MGMGASLPVCLIMTLSMLHEQDDTLRNMPRCLLQYAPIVLVQDLGQTS